MGLRLIHVVEGEDAQLWDAYVAARGGVATDLFPWRRAIEQAYGLKSFFVAAIDDSRIVGTLGLHEASHAVFGRYLATAPFGSDGGLFFDGEEARDALVAEGRRLADERDVDYLVVRARGAPLAGFQVDRHYETAVLDLEGGTAAVWERLPAKTRNQVRRGMKEGFSVEAGHAQSGPFQEVFHRHLRDLGSPAAGPGFYAAVVEQLGPSAEFLVVRDGRSLVAGALLLRGGETAMNIHTVSLRAFNRRCPNYLLYWKMIEASCERGCRRLDMGRSEAGGPNIKFKANWGPEILPLAYNYYLRKRSDVPYLDPRNPRYRLPILAWRRLPLFLTRRIGPRLMPGLL